MRHADDNVYSVNEPYPEIIVSKPNPMYVKLLLPNYSGIASEYTAISQYIYHKFKQFDINPKVASTIGGIAMVEMHHLDILATLIVKLGGDPRFFITRKGKCNYWDAKFVDYGCTLKEMLQFDINSEEVAIKNYKNTIKEISDENITKVIERIILDEELHLKLFKELYDEFVK